MRVTKMYLYNNVYSFHNLKIYFNLITSSYNKNFNLNI